jgi:hypothetical protein
LVKENEQVLYPNCKKYSKLSFMVHLYHLKCLHGWSDKSFSMLLDLLRDALPEGNILPKSYYETKKMILIFWFIEDDLWFAAYISIVLWFAVFLFSAFYLMICCFQYIALWFAAYISMFSGAACVCVGVLPMCVGVCCCCLVHAGVFLLFGRVVFCWA